MSDLLQTIQNQVLQEYRDDLRLGKLSWEEASGTVQYILWPEVCKRYAAAENEVLKKRIEELEAGLKKIDHGINYVEWYTRADIQSDIHELLHPSTNGKQ